MINVSSKGLFLPNGKQYKGATHKMGNTIMTGAVHTAKSVILTEKGFKPGMRSQ